MRYCDGDRQKADYFLDCSVYMYYYRIVQSSKFVEFKNEQIKEQTKK